ncbi:hypothetical protein [Sphingorhabdus sp.]|jgi:hypothetical protein|uniref:hypothetical protein n=1 Tax=Sphingorhabdus sp. TaxID=1902408 RepID=UPI003BAF16C6|nr:hypothetical protein [Sphingomonadales bacterium]MBK9432468.1 hypothetical protein [Sphingomonadales bacterium]MBL0021994.1 hypothetical protein [Sphingomonadales bacterium]
MMRYLIISWVSAVAVHLLGHLAMRDAPDVRGWRVVKPGPMYGVGVWLGAGLTALMAYIWLFVGSNRADGAQQMQILFWLILAFGAGTMIVIWQGWQVRRTALRWRGDQMVWRAGGAEISRRFADVVSMEKSLLGPVTISFTDGTRLRVDPNASHAMALIEALDGQGVR